MAWAVGVLVMAILSTEGAGDAIDVTVRGTLRTGVMAVGGESTGTTITAKGATWELDLRAAPELARRADFLSGRRVVVTGSLEARRGVARRQRWIVTVKTLEAAPGGHPAPRP